MDFRFCQSTHLFRAAGARRQLLVRCGLVLFALATGNLFTLQAQAASPSLGSITPLGAQRGTEVDVNFNGDRLGDADQILIYQPGVEVVSLERVSENTVKTKLRIAADCRLGAISMRVRTATGLSNLRTFQVGALKELSEAEPNSDFAAPQAIDLDSCVSGVIEAEDVDYFVVTAKQGERISAEIEGIRLGNTFFDPYVAIMDQGRFELSSSDDSALVWQDGVASIVAPADGNYIVQVRECAYGGNGACTYRLHVGRYPRPRAVLPAGGRPGQSLAVRWLGDVLGEKTAEVVLPQQSTAGFVLLAQDELGVAASGNIFRLGDLDNTLETEPNNGLAEATASEVPRAMNGVLEKAGDVDCFAFAATKGQVFDIWVYARQLRSPLDPVLNIYRAGAGVAGNDDSGGPDSYVRFTAPENDQYVLMVSDHLGQGGADYVYRIEVTPVVPKLVMGLPERSQFVDITTAIPRGNRTALLVSASRVDFGGELSVELAGLPAGVTCETIAMPANQSLVPVVLTATPEAERAGALVDVVGRTTDPNLKIEGHLLQRTSMVRGQNNIHVWDVDTDRMATAVADESPFSIEIVEPKVPLVHDGTMQLKVIAKRKEGFTAPIAVRMLYDPPGVGSSGGIAIAEGQTEALIPLNANTGAEVKTWKIAILGEATVGNGQVLVSSQLANLTIAPPFVTFAYQAAAVEQGQETEVVIAVTKNADFEGAAQVELLGLPNEVTTTPQEITKDTTQVIFKVKTTANSPAGKHRTLLCRTIVTASAEPITHMLGTGELRIDTPLPKPAEVAQAPAAAPPAAEPEKPPEKRLTLLEKLRLERQKAKEAAKAAAEAAAAAPPAETPASEATATEAPAEAAPAEAPPAEPAPAAPGN